MGWVGWLLSWLRRRAATANEQLRITWSSLQPGFAPTPTRPCREHKSPGEPCSTPPAEQCAELDTLRACLSNESDGAAPPTIVMRSDGNSSWCGLIRLRNRAASQLTNPDGYVYVETAQQVRQAVRCAKASKRPVCALSGRHTYEAICVLGGLLIDVRGFQSVELDNKTGVAALGAGLCLGQVYAELSDMNRTLAAGTCPTVGIAGLTLGGGKGVLTRAHGLTADHLVSLDVVTAEGNIITISEDSRGDEAELFWLSQGGGGGQFPGVVTTLRLQTVPLPSRVSVVNANFSRSDALTVLQTWESSLMLSPRLLLFPRLMLFANSDVVKLELRIPSDETETASDLLNFTDTLISQLEGAVSPTSTPTVRLMTYVESVVDMGLPPDQRNRQALESCEAGWDSGYETSFHFRAAVFGSEASTGRSWPPTIVSMWDALDDQIEQPNNAGYLMIDATNGATNSVSTASAYPWRTTQYGITMQIQYGWDESTTYVQDKYEVASEQLSLSLSAATQSNASYINYLDFDRPAEDYFGANSARVLRTMRLYDPSGVFNRGNNVFNPGNVTRTEA